MFIRLWSVAGSDAYWQKMGTATGALRIAASQVNTRSRPNPNQRKDDMMRKFLLATTTIVTVTATMSFASPMTDSIISQLQAQGYDRIEIKEGPNQVKVEAINGETRFEAIYDIATGAVLKQEAYAVTDDDDITLGVAVETEDRDFVEVSDHDEDDDEDDNS